MNTYIDAQITNAIAFIKAFEQSCTMAAMDSDGHINKEEAIQLKKVNKAADRFIRELEKIR